jgi:UDP-glucose 4-epimerase
MPKRTLIVGGAGFIGSHFVDRLLADAATQRVVAYDNLSSGHTWHVAQHETDTRFQLVIADVRDSDALTTAMEGIDTVIHLASNPDIARAVKQPSIDFDAGTLLTHLTLEAARVTGASLVLYASGSGVYGDVGDTEVDEDFGPLAPISTYAASKLAGEALLASYCAMFGLRGRSFRFANVVGRRQTHGVGFDFVHRLLENPDRLVVLGDGRQSKSYIAVRDVVDAVMTAADRDKPSYEVYNVATRDYVTVDEIAALAIGCLGLNPLDVTIEHTGGDRGWKGDVPVVRLNADRIRGLGWAPTCTSAEALREAITAGRDEARADAT